MNEGARLPTNGTNDGAQRRSFGVHRLFDLPDAAPRHAEQVTLVGQQHRHTLGAVHLQAAHEDPAVAGFDNQGARLPGALYTQVIEILAETFGGVTAFSRSPGEGLWRSGSEGDTRRDDVVVFEVMVEELDAEWWKGYRRSLERSFHQDEIVIRASVIVRL